VNDMAIEYKRRDITVDEYHRMADAGIFHPDERVELIDGELIEMPPLGLSHWSRHAVLTRHFINLFGDRALVVPQGSFPLGRRNEPQPDFAIFANIDYAARNERPTLDEIYAFVEIANTSAAFDRGRKMRMYGLQRVREYLLVDLKHNRLTLFGGSNDVGYADSRELTYGDSFSFSALADITLSADPFLDARPA
jgi:Uma2 family endonuclease